jgi:molecular chaperone Hsp33
VNPNASRAYLKKALNAGGEVLIVSIEARDLLQEQLERIQAHPPAMVHLGQAMMAASLLQALGDPADDDRIQSEWLTRGEFGAVFAEVLGTGKIRGTIGQPQAPAETLGHKLGAGLFRVRKQRGQEPPYTGFIESSGDVSTDLVEYLEKSEQRTCGANLSVKIEWDEAAAQRGSPLPFRVSQASGFLVHILPQDNEARHQELLIQWDVQIRALGHLSKWGLTKGGGPRVCLDILQQLTHEEHPKVIFDQEIRLFCTCSEDRAARALALAKAQADPALPVSEQGAADVTCEFCGNVYTI